MEEWGRTGYLVLNQRGNGFTSGGGEGQNWISCPHLRGSGLMEGGGEGQNWIFCPHLKRQLIDIRWRRWTELDILSSLEEATD